MRALTRLLIWLAAGTGAALVLLVIMLYFLEVDMFRERIARHVSEAFDREVLLQGPMVLKPSLTPRLMVQDVRIANPDWASHPFLAKVSGFDVRVSLLPLLRGELVIRSIEFHGVELWLEKTANGDNNFTFDRTGEPSVLPAIEHLSLHDASIAYKGAGQQPRTVHLQQLTARKVPGHPVELQARTSINTVPVEFSLQGQPQEPVQPDAPWQIHVDGRIGGLSVRLAGRLAGPGNLGRGDFRLDLHGHKLDDLETVSGVTLPEAQPVRLGADIRFALDKAIDVENISAEFGSSDIHGSLHALTATPRPAIHLSLESDQLHAADLAIDQPTLSARSTHDRHPDQPAPAVGMLAGIDLDAKVRIGQFTGLGKELQSVSLSAHADSQALEITLGNASLGDIHITADASMPWGEQLGAEAPAAINLDALLQLAQLDVRAEIPKTGYSYVTSLLGTPLALELSSVEASARPGDPLMLQTGARLNNRPVSAILRSVPLTTLVKQPDGPWEDLSLEVRGEDVQLDARGRIASPLVAEGIEASFTLGGSGSGILLPLQGAWALSGRYTGEPKHHAVDQLRFVFGRSDISGRGDFHLDGPRPRLVANLESRQLHMDEFVSTEDTGSRNTRDLDQPLEIDGLAGMDLDIQARIQRLYGLEKPVQDIRLTALADEHSLSVQPVSATVEAVRLDAQALLPWGTRLKPRGRAPLSWRSLLQRADLALQADVPAGKLQQETALLGHQLRLDLGRVEATARPGKALHISASAGINDIPVEASLQAEPLTGLLQRPEGPWKDLSIEVRGGDIQLRMNGRVDRPFKARGFDFRYALQGARIEELLPIINLIVPLEGAYSLTGHFSDLPDRLVFDDLRITSGRTDIGGQISVYGQAPRPRLVADLHSQQIYLGELLPVSEAGTAPGAARIIPDYTLPIDRLREIDGELRFSGKRLRTPAGDLGDINFRATLDGGVLRIDPLRVRGWAGALIESDATIDASQDPPGITWQWIARQLNYGVLLDQAGLAETVEGTLDISLQLSGNGYTRYEMLGNADGQLVIVGQEGRFGSRRLDLWGSDLLTTMLSRNWRSEDVTDINCLVARITIQDGIASSDDLLVDTNRITIGAAGTLDLKSEELNFIIAPQPKRTSLVSLSSPVHVTGTLAAPEVSVTVLPRNRMAAAGTGLLAGLINPGYLIFTFAQTGSGVSNPCVAAINDAMIMKGRTAEIEQPQAEEPAPARFSLLPGCTRAGQRHQP